VYELFDIDYSNILSKHDIIKFLKSCKKEDSTFSPCSEFNSTLESTYYVLYITSNMYKIDNI
jgi:hypothetical protein